MSLYSGVDQERDAPVNLNVVPGPSSVKLDISCSEPVVVDHVQTAVTARRLPPASASSEEVLRRCLRAAVAHNCALTGALTAADSPETPGDV